MGTFGVVVFLQRGSREPNSHLCGRMVVCGKSVGGSLDVDTLRHLGSLEVGPHLGGFTVKTVGLVGRVGLVCLCVGT